MSTEEKELVITRPAKLRILNDSILGKKTRVYINDQDVSRFIKRIVVFCDVDGIVEAEVTFLAKDGFEIAMEEASLNATLIIDTDENDRTDK